MIGRDIFCDRVAAANHGTVRRFRRLHVGALNHHKVVAEITVQYPETRSFGVAVLQRVKLFFNFRKRVRHFFRRICRNSFFAGVEFRVQGYNGLE